MGESARAMSVPGKQDSPPSNEIGGILIGLVRSFAEVYLWGFLPEETKHGCLDIFKNHIADRDQHEDDECAEDDTKSKGGRHGDQELSLQTLFEQEGCEARKRSE